MSASCTMLPDLSPQTTRAFADVTHHAVAGHAAIGQILISFVEDGKLMVSDDLSEEELDDLGLAGEITVEFLEAHKFYLKHHQVRFRGRRAPPRQRLNRRRTRGASTRATCSRRRRHPVRASSLLTIETCEISAPSARGYLSADEATVNMAKRTSETAQMTLSRLFAASF
jgi:hypothetical protein